MFESEKKETSNYPNNDPGEGFQDSSEKSGGSSIYNTDSWNPNEKGEGMEEVEGSDSDEFCDMSSTSSDQSKDNFTTPLQQPEPDADKTSDNDDAKNETDDVPLLLPDQEYILQISIEDILKGSKIVAVSNKSVQSKILEGRVAAGECFNSAENYEKESVSNTLDNCENELYRVPLVPPVKNGSIVMGQSEINCSCSHLPFRIVEEPHKYYRRYQSDLQVTACIDPITALKGGVIYVRTLDIQERWIELITLGVLDQLPQPKALRWAVKQNETSIGDIFEPMDEVFHTYSDKIKSSFIDFAKTHFELLPKTSIAQVSHYGESRDIEMLHIRVKKSTKTFKGYGLPKVDGKPSLRGDLHVTWSLDGPVRMEKGRFLLKHRGVTYNPRLGDEIKISRYLLS